MASNALEEKINKIRQQNEEIRRRYEEVEEDKKNAAKLNALVQMVPSTDWPERKEPPEFLNPPKTKIKSTKEKHEYTLQSHIGEGKKIHSFSQGEGPPPDPKYNFLADSEREEPAVEYTRENSGSRSHHKVTRGSFRKKMNGRESNQKDNKSNKGNYRDESQPGYDAWRAERNRIDEDRINRQRTAEGNWRREWDNDKVHIIDDGAKKLSRPTLGDFTKKDYKDSDRRYHANNNEHVNYTRSGNHRPHRGSTKNFYSNYENRSHNTYDQHRNNIVASVKNPVSPTTEERTVIATEKSIKVTVNQSNVTKGQLMSVKVNSPSIAGTGRVGPRQRTRVTYSQSDVDASPTEGEPFFRQKSFEDKSKGTFFNNQKFPNLKRSHSQKKKENETKYQYHQKKDVRKEDSDGNSSKYYENEFKSYTQKDQQKSYSIKSPKPSKGNMKLKHDSSSVDVSQKYEIQESSISNEVELEQNVEQNIGQNIELNIGQNIEPNIGQNIEQNIGQNIEPNIGQNIEPNIGQNIEPNIGQNIEPNIGQSIEPNIGQNIEPNIGQSIEPNIGQNIEPNIGQNIEPNIGQNIEPNIEHNIELNPEQNIERPVEQNIEPTVEQNIEPTVEQNIEHTVEQNIENTVEQNIEPTVEHNIEPTVEQNIEHTVEQNIEPTVEQNIEHTVEQNIEHTVEQNIEYTVEENIEHDIVTKNSSTLQEIKFEANEIPNTENVQSNIENEVTSEVLPVKEVETKEISLTSISSIDNSEHIAKDITNKNSFENKSEGPDSPATKVTEDLQENSNMSSEVSVPNDVQFSEELMSNKSNEVLDNVKIDKTFLHKDDQQSLKQVTKQFVDDDCDNIEDETMVQQNIKGVTDNSVLEEKTYSVIEINNQSVCNNKLIEESQLVQKETLNLEKETEETNETSDKNLKNTLNSCEIKSENTLSSINVDESSLKEVKEKIEETKDAKEELINKENDKALQ